MEKNILIICGKSASGKDTLLNRVVNELGYKRIVSTTTRPMRDGEVDGVDYNFVTEGQFKEKINSGEMLEFRAYNALKNGQPVTWYYGTEKVSIHNNKWVGVLDITGAKAWRNVYKGRVLTMMLLCPDDVRKERAEARGSFDESEWERRLQADTADFASEKWIDVIDVVQKNVKEGDLDCILESIKANERGLK